MLADLGICLAILTNSEVKPKNKGPLKCLMNTFSLKESLNFFSSFHAFSLDMVDTLASSFARSPIFFIKNNEANTSPIPTA